MDWGMSLASFKSKYGTPYRTSANVLMYETNNFKAPYALYLFEDGKLKASSVAVKYNYASELGDFLLERYMPIAVDSDKLEAYFAHAYGSVDTPKIDFVVLMSYESSMSSFLVLYSPYSESKSGRTIGSKENNFPPSTVDSFEKAIMDL